MRWGLLQLKIIQLIMAEAVHLRLRSMLTLTPSFLRVLLDSSDTLRWFGQQADSLETTAARIVQHLFDLAVETSEEAEGDRPCAWVSCYRVERGPLDSPHAQPALMRLAGVQDPDLAMWPPDHPLSPASCPAIAHSSEWPHGLQVLGLPPTAILPIEAIAPAPPLGHLALIDTARLPALCPLRSAGVPSLLGISGPLLAETEFCLMIGLRQPLTATHLEPLKPFGLSIGLALTAALWHAPQASPANEPVASWAMLATHTHHCYEALLHHSQTQHLDQQATIHTLQQRENCYSRLISAIAQSVWRTDHEGSCLSLWTAASHSTAPTPSPFTSSQPVRESWLEVVHPHDRPQVQQAWRDALRHPQPYHASFRQQCRNGTYQDACCHAVPLYDDRGAVQEWVGIIVGADRSHPDQLALQASEERLRRLFDQAEIGIVQSDLTGRFVLTNPKYARMLQYTPDELVGKTFQDVTYPDDRELDRDQVKRLLAGEISKFSLEKRYLRKDHTLIWVKLTACLMHDAQGNPSHFIGIVEDIHARKLAEETLQRTEATKQAIIDALPDLIFRLSREGVYLDVLAKDTSDLLLSSRELIGQHINDVVPEAIAQRGLYYFAKALDTQTVQVYEYELEINGNVEYFEARTVPCSDHDVLCIVRDITERRHIELAHQQAVAALQHREQYFQALTENSADIILILDAEGRIRYCSPSVEKVLGYTPDEVLGCPAIDFVNPEHRTLILNTLETAIHQAGVRQPRVDYQVRTNDGRWRDFEAITTNLLHDPTVQGVVVNCRDVSDRRQAERSLYKALALFETLFDKTPLIAIQGLDPQGVIHHWNEASSRFYQIDKDAALGRRIQDLLLDQPDHLAAFEAELQTVLTTQQPTPPTEWVLTLPSGDTIHGYSVMMPIVTEGAVTAVFCMDVDITDRKRMEEALQQSQEMLQTVMDNIPQRIFWKDRNLTYLGCNRRNAEVVGLASPDHIVGKTDFDLTSFEQAEQYRQRDRHIMATDTPQYNILGTRLTAEGQLRWTESNKIPLHDSQGNVIGILGTVEDVTERKLANDALQQREEQLRLVLQNMPVMMNAFDEQGQFIIWNQDCERVTGYSAQEIIGNPQAMRLLYPDAEYLQQKFDEWQQLGNNYRNFEWVLTTKAGDRRVTAWSNISDDFPIPGWASWGIGIDITDRVMAQAALTTRSLQQAAIAKLGQKALAGIPLSTLMDEAVHAAAEGLGVDTVELMELQPDGETLQIRSTVGQPCHEQSLSLHELSCETQAAWSRLQRDMTSSMSVSIADPDRLYGVLHLYSETQRHFNPDDALFLQAIANILSTAIARKRSEDALRSSEERYRSVVTVMTEGIIVVGKEGRILACNASAERILGIPHTHIIGNFVFDETWPAIAEDGSPVGPEAIPALITLRTGQPQTNVILGVQKLDGHLCWLSVNTQPIWNPDNTQPEGVVASFTDITQRKIAEEELRQQTELLQTIFNHIPVMISFIAADGTFKLVNPEQERVLGWAHADYLSTNILQEWYPNPSDCQAVLEHIITADGSWQDFKTRFRGGQLIDTTWANIRLSDGSLIGIGQDITERKRTEELLRLNEARLSEALKIARLGYWEYDVEHDQFIFNEQIYRLLGTTAAEQGSFCMSREAYSRQFTYSDDECLVQRSLEQAIASSDLDFFCQIEERIIRPRGDSIVGLIRLRVLKDESNRAVKVYGTLQDITERKRAEDEIRMLNEELEQLVEQRTAELLTFINALPDSIFVVNRDDMRIPFCNDLMTRITGHQRRQDIEGKPVYDCLPPEYVTQFIEQNHRVFEEGITLRVQEELHLPHGTLHLDTIKIPLKRPNGEVYALIGSARDVTELVKARQALSERTQQLEAINRELESFSYSVSHDLRAPLRHISGFVSALSQRLEALGYATDPKVNHYLHIIHSSSQKMGHLIDGLLMLSRVGRRQLTKAPVALRPLVDAAIALCESAALVQTADSALPSVPLPEFVIGELPIVQGDATLLQQVFTNLIDNAIKFSRPVASPHIEIGALADGTLYIRDNGVGFSMEYASELFGAFQRLHSQHEFEGTGIGLAIVQRIIHRHGGNIWAESAPNQGAVFYFNLQEPETGDRPT